MRVVRAGLAWVFLGLAGCGASSEGPVDLGGIAFGVREGQPVSAFKVTGQDHKGAYFVQDVPAPSRMADFYVLIAFPETGVCKVDMATRSHEGDVSGAAERAEFAHMKAAAVARLGPATTIDALKAGSALSAPNQWSKAVLADDRELSAKWTGATGARLPADIDSASLEARGQDNGATYTAFTYTFKNIGACRKFLS